MSGIPLLWKQDSRHLKAQIPDTILIKDGAIQDWFFSSNKGFILKHRKQSSTISAILRTFSSHLQQNDPIVAIQRSFDSGPKLLLSSHFELFIMQVTNASLPPELSSTIIQKFSHPSSNFLLRVTYSPTRLQVKSSLFNENYLINGKFRLSLNYEETHPSQQSINQVKSLTNQLVQALESSQDVLVEQAQFEWIKDQIGQFLLMDVVSLNLAAIKPLRVQSVSELPENITPASISVRPPSVPRNRLSYNRKALSINSNRFNTPKSRRWGMEQSLSKQLSSYATPRAALNMVDIRNKNTQTDFECCEFKVELDRNMAVLVKQKTEREVLEEKIKKLEDIHTQAVAQLNEAWKHKCFELCQNFNQKLLEQKKKLV